MTADENKESKVTGEEIDQIELEVEGARTLTVVFRQDGTGCVEPEDYNYEFTHDLDLVSLEYQFADYEQLEEYLALYFWDYVNPTFYNDRFLRDYAELERHELEFTLGNAEEFNRLMRLFLLTEPDLEKATRSEVVIKTATPDTLALLSHQYSYGSERLDRLVQLAFKEHQPTGYFFEYNDNGYGRFSCYDRLPIDLTYELEEFLQASAREKMSARAKLREWLVARGQDLAQYGLEDWEKVYE
jgi:hypothetical protein